MFLAVTASPTVGGDDAWGTIFHKHFGHQHVPPGQIETLNGGAWHWMRSPEQEKTVVMSLYNRYCIRCHGVDGRGVWDIPGFPDFTDVRWQNYPHRPGDRPDHHRRAWCGDASVPGCTRARRSLGPCPLPSFLRARHRDVEAGGPQSARAGLASTRVVPPAEIPSRPRPKAHLPPRVRPRHPRAPAQHESNTRTIRSLIPPIPCQEPPDSRFTVPPSKGHGSPLAMPFFFNGQKRG